MNCSEIHTDLPLYADGLLGPESAARVASHLQACPVCRSRQSQMVEIAEQFRRLAAPQIPDSLRMELRRTVSGEIAREKTRWLPIPGYLQTWLVGRVMPYAIGAAASVVIGLTVLTMLFSGLRDEAPPSTFSGPSSMLLAANTSTFSSDTLTPSEYARTRLDVSNESPSINPQGALAALGRSIVRGSMKDDEVVVVADVFSDGLAKVAEVVEPGRNDAAVAELEKALASNDPRYSAFVAANLDRRSDNMRVVLRFQNVDVPTGRRHRSR